MNSDINEEAEKEPASLESADLQGIKEAIREQAVEEELPHQANRTLRRILGGDFLTAKILKRQAWLIVIVVAFTLLYVSNRYNCQQDLLKINDLNEQLKDAKYRALSSSSELTELSRESNVLEMLRNNKDSVLHIADQPPYIINVPAEDEQ